MATSRHQGSRPAVAARMLVALHGALYRRTGGRIGARFVRRTLLLLTTTGRRSGRARTTPLQYIRDESSYVVTASNWGRDAPPAWYLNLLRTPNATIQVGSMVMRITAVQATTEEKRRLWPVQVARDRTFARYQEKTKHEIPMIILRLTDV